MFIPPMLLETRPEPFNDERYVFEPKIDGYRLQIVRVNNATRIFTRNGKDVTTHYPELLNVPVDGDAIIDGEGAVIDPTTGEINFELMQESSRSGKKSRLPVTFFGFDILWHNGRDLRLLPLMDRKRILASVVGQNEACVHVTSIVGRGVDLFEVIRQKRMEGIVSKRIGSVYVSERSPAWLKIINWTYADVFITGIRKGEFGWLSSVRSQDGCYKPVGIIELGVTPTAKAAFNGVVKSLITGEDKNFIYLAPKLRARVKTRNWTRSGKLRSPVFVEFVI